MQNLENVYEQSAQAEQGSVIVAADCAEEEMKGLADLGKFKDVSALMQAYASLQAEFTRRSQRLKRYEEKERNQAREADKAEGGELNVKVDASDDSDAGFSFAEAENVEAVDTNQTFETAESETDDNGCTMANVVGTNLHEQVASGNTPSLYEQVMENEEVRLKIVGDYLSSIGKSGAPLVQGGRGVLTTPVKKARSIEDAGTMALAYLTAQKQGR